MAQSRQLLNKLSGFTIKTKLTAAFLALAVLAGLVGLTGWYFMGTIDQSLKYIAQAAAPTVRAADDLAVNLEMAKSLTRKILTEETLVQVETRSKDFQELARRFEGTFQELESLVRDEKLRENLKATRQAHHMFLEYSGQMIEARRAELGKAEEARKSLEAFDANGARLVKMLDQIAETYKAQMTEAEEKGNQMIKVLDDYAKGTESESGADEVAIVTAFEDFVAAGPGADSAEDLLARLSKLVNDKKVDLLALKTRNIKIKRASTMTAAQVNSLLGEIFKEKFPPFESSLKLQHLTARIQDASGRYLSETEPEKLAPLEKKFKELFALCEPHVRVLINKAGTLEDKSLASNMDKVLSSWDDEALGEGKLFAVYRARLEAGALAATLAGKVEEQGRAAADALTGIVAAADRISRAAQAEAAGAVGTATTILLGVILFGFALSLAAGLVLTRSITGPVGRAVELAEAMAAGDLSRTLDIGKRDEIGHLTRALDRTIGSLGLMFKEIAAGVETLSGSSAELTGISREMSSGADRTRLRAEAVAGAAGRMSAHMETVAAALEEASAGVDSVAAAAEEMTATVNEIAGNTEKAASIAAGAVKEAEDAGRRMNELDQAAREADMVTRTITEISEQTKLLALNATIEAARAGEAGKGFAVVAGEIKELARGTAEATQEVKRKIDGIQASARGTMERIGRITSVINEVNQIVSVIAAAVEEQSATTNEVARNMTQASAGLREVTGSLAETTRAAGEISREISQVNQAAARMNDQSSQVDRSAAGLAGLAEQLQGLVGQFKT
ncbi:MAG: methyl-accepting chemotaxis protein [Thermodesulfobacteriota bacterium]